MVEFTDAQGIREDDHRSVAVHAIGKRAESNLFGPDAHNREIIIKICIEEVPVA